MIDRERVGSLLRKHGRAYVGIERPKGYRRQWRRKDCYRNAILIAIRGEATYVEGLCSVGGLCSDGMHGIDHAWITLDGKHAIDPTLPYAPQRAYFGIEFPAKLVAQRMSRDDFVSPMLDDLEIVAVLETAADTAEAQAALRSLDLIDRASALERAGICKVGIEGPINHVSSVRIEEIRWGFDFDPKKIKRDP